MKKILLFLSIMLPITYLGGQNYEKYDNQFVTAFTAGYVFKNGNVFKGDRFKQIYGLGMTNIITGDGCYFPWEHLGFGAKISYFRAKGLTDFLQYPTHLQQVPVTFSIRARKEFDTGFQLYGCTGAGFAWLKEKSYLGKTHFYKGLGELELGFLFPVWRCVHITAAVRYLFPPQTHAGEKIDAGGVDLRAGIAFFF